MIGQPPLLPDPSEIKRRNARTALTVLGVVVGMIGLSYASVPLYRLFCQVTGFGGTPLISDRLPETVLDRTVTIRFNADVGANMPWIFQPEQRQVKVRLGQKGLIAFHATNTTASPMTGTALYNVTPPKAGQYFHKVQCFCFGEQVLGPHQNATLPVMFFIDPSMDKDPNMNDVTDITLSYTFYEAQSPALDKAMQGFYNR
jgi:cytochrome c oxidase assembly protein subunit 11